MLREDTRTSGKLMGRFAIKTRLSPYHEHNAQKVRPEILVQRVFAKQQALDYWESGMDLGLSRDMFDSFLQYQSRMRDTFRRMQRHYGFDLIDAERPVERISADLQNKIETVLAGG